MRRFLAIAVVLALSGCLDPHRVQVDEALLENSPHDWIKTEFDQVNNGNFGPKVVQTEYRVDPEGPPFPAIFLTVGVRGWTELSQDDLLAKTREIVGDVLQNKSVVVDSSTELEGGRSLANGAETKWFRVIGTSNAGDIFQSEEEIRVFAETFYDGRSKTAVILIGLAQTTETTRFLTVQTTENYDTWNEMVADPFGIIDGAVGEGFAYNVVSHG